MFSHVDENLNPTMVDISDKSVTKRYAKAQSIVELPSEVISQFKDGDIRTKKGPVFHTAIVAGTMAAKRTHDMIPFCHPLPVESCKIIIKVDDIDRVLIQCTVGTSHKTGVEMEALVGANIAALTVYDMCKAYSQNIRILNTELLEKTGGKSDFKR